MFKHLFKQRNDSIVYDGVFSIFTGEDDISKLDVMDMWNYTRQTKCLQHLIER